MADTDQGSARGDGSVDPPAEPWSVGRDVCGHVWRTPEPRARLLLQHGFAEHAGRYVVHHDRFVPRMLALGIDVHAIDLRGHGRSPGPRGRLDVEQAVRDHIVARDRLGDDLPVFLFGHSLGGLVTALSVARRPHRVAGVILSAPALLHPVPTPVRWIVGLLGRIAPGLGIVPGQPATGLSRDDAYLAALADDPLICRTRVCALTAASTLAVADEGWSRYRDWRAPVLVLHGTADTYTDPAGSGLFHAMVAGEDRQLFLSPGGRHELLNDLDRERASSIVWNWIADRIA